MPPDGPERDSPRAKRKRSRSELEEELQKISSAYKSMKTEIQNVIEWEMKTGRAAFTTGTPLKRLKLLGCKIHATLEMRDGTKYDLDTQC